MKIFRKTVLLLVTFIFLYFVFINLDFNKLFNILKDFDLKYILPLVISITLSPIFRGICHKLFISEYVNAPLKFLIPLCITGSALNIVLPARAGDIFRAYYTGIKYDADKIKLFGSIILERIFDGLVILSMLICAIILYNKNPLAQKLSIAAAFIFIGSLTFAFITVKYKKIDSLCSFFIEKTGFLPPKIKTAFDSLINFTNKTCTSFINGFEILLYPKKLLLAVFFFCGIWFFEALKYYFIIQGFHCEVSTSIVLFIISFLALACMIPSASIFIGPYQFAVISAFAIYNINKETALAASFVEQAATTIITTAIALIFMFKNNITLKDIKKEPLE